MILVGLSDNERSFLLVAKSSASGLPEASYRGTTAQRQVLVDI